MPLLEPANSIRRIFRGCHQRCAPASIQERRLDSPLSNSVANQEILPALPPEQTENIKITERSRYVAENKQLISIYLPNIWNQIP
jgi:hypothetical protein